MRIGEALGLRHEDIEIAERGLRVVPRANDNRARAKAGRTRTIPASAELSRLYADYLNREYGTLDSDYVFVNLWGQPRGHPLTYPAVYDLVGRLRRRTGVVFGPRSRARGPVRAGPRPAFPPARVPETARTAPERTRLAELS